MLRVCAISPLPVVTYSLTTTSLIYHDNTHLPLMISPSYITDLYLLGAATNRRQQCGTHVDCGYNLSEPVDGV
jgi:hypothetical protein